MACTRPWGGIVREWATLDFYRPDLWMVGCLKIHGIGLLSNWDSETHHRGDMDVKGNGTMHNGKKRGRSFWYKCHTIETTTSFSSESVMTR